MKRTSEPSGVRARLHRALTAAAVVSLLVVGCSKGPSKSDAMAAIRRGVQEDGRCTLPASLLTKLKMQYTTKGICVPKENADDAKACMDALVAANITRRMPDSYMILWPDHVASAAFTDVPAYERRARSLMYSTCVVLLGDLREGQFECAEVRPAEILEVGLADPTHAKVRYSRTVVPHPTLAAIDAACGGVSRPPRDSTVVFVKGESGWTLEGAVTSVVTH